MDDTALSQPKGEDPTTPASKLHRHDSSSARSTIIEPDAPFETILLPFVKQICLGRAQVHNLGAAVPVLFVVAARSGVGRASNESIHLIRASVIVVPMPGNSNQSIRSRRAHPLLLAALAAVVRVRDARAAADDAAALVGAVVACGAMPWGKNCVRSMYGGVVRSQAARSSTHIRRRCARALMAGRSSVRRWRVWASLK